MLFNRLSKFMMVSGRDGFRVDSWNTTMVMCIHTSLLIIRNYDFVQHSYVFVRMCAGATQLNAYKGRGQCLRASMRIAG